MMLEHAATHWPEHFGGVDIGRSLQSSTRINLPGSGKVEPCTAGSASKDGGKESFAVGDEPHLYTSPELRRMYATVSRNLTKRKAADPWMLLTSTWFMPGEQSVAEARWDQAVAIAEGRARNTGLLYDHRHGTIPAEWDDDDAMLAGLAEAAGAAAGWMNLDRTLEEIRKPDTLRSDAKRYFFNTLDGAEEDVCSVGAWRALERHVRLSDGDVVALGFDGSDSDDATALFACRWPDFTLFSLDVWERPAEAKDGWRVPRLQVHEAVEDAFRRFRVVRGYFDPPKWRTDIDTWAASYGDKVVLEYPTFSDTRMAPATERLAQMISDQTVGHDGDPALARHVAAAKRSKCRGGWRPAKKDSRKIDALVAAILAVHALGDAVAAGLVVDTEPTDEAIALVL
jgi:phage terminase large subunit-like protein